MSIVQTVVSSVHGNVNEKRMIWFKCQDDQGVWHKYGPIITNDPTWDPDTHLQMVADKVSASLAEAEANSILGGV